MALVSLRVSVFVGFVALAGCGHEHVVLSAPEPTAPLRERAEAFERLSPPNPVEWTHGTVTQDGAPSSSNPIRPLELSNGTVVHYAEDLLPVLPEQSESAVAARKSLAERKKGELLGRIGAGVAVFSLVPTFWGLANVNPNDYSYTAAGLGAGVAIVLVGAILVGVGKSHLADSDQAKLESFLSYEAGLRNRLDACKVGGKWKNCSSPKAAAKPPPGAILPVPPPDGAPTPEGPDAEPATPPEAPAPPQDESP